MSESNEIQIHEAIRTYLNEIAERLWSGHAAVMVGSGFSKNAKADADSDNSFPDWAQLGDLFYEKVHGQQPDHPKYLNVLKLADEVQAAFGRPVLDQLLRTSIPDNDHEPSTLHVKLLELPWTDVFTTNYDTLLERACSSVTSQKYDVVVNKEDLVYSERPRIVKLHGSFPSGRPLIITEEDYRKYPKSFAPFVNTVQQALLENTLCLIGFSGDDPNFLQWIGWIRDNLGRESSPKIYLIGIFRISDAQKRLFGQRNIVLVDLADCPDIEDDHYKALDRFVEYLMSRKGEDNRLGWPMDKNKIHPDRDSTDKSTQLRGLLRGWKDLRETYPGWCVLPEDRRNPLWLWTREWIDFVFPDDKLPVPLDLEFAYELNWRLERCLCPILDNVAKLFENILQRYWPFPGSDQVNASSTNLENIDYQDLPWKDIRQMWLHLSLSMLRLYREEGLHEKWQDTVQILDSVIHYLSPDQKAFLSYERALYALFALDVPEVKKQLNAWPSNESLSFWEAKRAGLMAEIGRIDEAEKILEQSLQNIRSKLNLQPITTDYSLVSQESFSMLLLHYVRNAAIFRKGNWTWTEGEEQRRQFTERWNALRRYKCDPWNELKLFESRLEQTSIEKPAIIEKREFDIGRVSRTHQFSGWDQEAFSAYAFLRFCEDAGIPFRIPGSTIGKKSAQGTLARISIHSPYWALATLVRIGDVKVIDHIFNRESLHKLDVASIDKLIDGYLKAIDGSQDDIKTGSAFHVDNLGILLAQIIPEILSRLCSKCSYEARRQLLKFLLEVFKSDQKTKFRGILNLTERLLESLSDHQKLVAIPQLLEFPIVGDIDPITNREFINPFTFLHIDKTSPLRRKKIVLDETRIQSLFEHGRSENAKQRKWATFTLVQLHRLGVLKEDWTDKIGKVLWEQRDHFGLPAHTDYYKFAFLDLPHPDGVDPVPLFKEYVQKTFFPIQKKKVSPGVAITSGDVPICHEIVGASRVIQWTEKEIISIFGRLVEWWDMDKEFLRKDEEPHFMNPISEEFKTRFLRLISVFSEVVAPILSQSTDDTIKDTALRLLSELDKFGLPSLGAWAACVHFLPDSRLEVISKVEDALGSNEKEVVIDGLGAILRIFKKEKTAYSEPELSVFLYSLGQLLRWRRKIGLVSALNMVTELIREQPSCFANGFQGLVLKGLKDITKDTDLTNGSADLDFPEKLEIRLAAAGLAYMLFVFYAEQGKPVPEVLKVWGEICRSKNEFAEIRNQWLSIDDG